MTDIKGHIDLCDFAISIDNLKKPGMMRGALIALEKFIVKKTGTKMGFLYQELIEDALAALKDKCVHTKPTPEKVSIQLPLLESHHLHWHCASSNARKS